MVLLELLGLLLRIQVAYAAVHALLEAKVLWVGLHERLRRLGHRYRSVLGLACDSRSLNLTRMLSGIEILLHLARAHVLGEAVVLDVVIHVLAHWLGAILFVEVLQIHTIYSLALATGGSLERIHFAGVHLRVIWVERPCVVAHHLLAHCAWRLSISLLTILGHHQVLGDVVGSCPTSEVNRMIRFLASGARHHVARHIELLLISRVLGPFHGLLVWMLGLQRGVQAGVGLLRLVEVNGRVVELEVGKFLLVALAGRALCIYRTALFVLVCCRPDVVGVVGRCVQGLVFAHRQGLVVLPLANRSRPGPLRRLVLIMVLLWCRVNRLVPPIPRVQSTVWSLLGDGVGLGSRIHRLPRCSKCVVVAHVARESIVQLRLHLLSSHSLHEAVHHQIVRLYDRGVDDGAELLLGVRVHLHLARGETIADVPLVLLAAWLRAVCALLLGSRCVHVVRPPGILIAAGGVLHRGVGDILYLAWSHALGGGIDLVGHACTVQGVLIFCVLWWPVLTKPTITFSGVLDRHVHPVLHFKLGLLLLQLALIPDMV